MSFQNEAVPTFPVVCIGGSAGSLAAFTSILQAIPEDSGFAVVIVSHRAPAESDLLVKLLARASRMEVVGVTDGISLTAGRVFVTPPRRDITTDGTELILSDEPTIRRGWPTQISNFIFSLADGCVSRAIAIIVSGMGFDGSSGLGAIKKAGGWTIAQSDASFIDMPQAAIDTTHVDLVLRADEIGTYLASLSAHLALARTHATHAALA